MYSGGVSSRFHPGFAPVKKPKRQLKPVVPPTPPKQIALKPAESLGVRMRLNISGRHFEAYSYIFEGYPLTLLGILF